MLCLDLRYLARVRFEAMRRRVWFKALSSLERGLVDSVIKVFDRPRSLTLIMVLVKIIVKVKRAMMNPLKQIIIQVGKLLARKMSIIAVKWGNKNAAKWAEDEGFIKYLAVMYISNPFQIIKAI